MDEIRTISLKPSRKYRPRFGEPYIRKTPVWIIYEKRLQMGFRWCLISRIKKDKICFKLEINSHWKDIHFFPQKNLRLNWVLLQLPIFSFGIISHRLCERVIIVYHQMINFSAITCRSYIRWNDDDVCLVGCL